MKKGKCKSDSQTNGSAPSTDAHPSRETGGNSKKHMNRPDGWKGRKYIAGTGSGV